MNRTPLRECRIIAGSKLYHYLTVVASGRMRVSGFGNSILCFVNNVVVEPCPLADAGRPGLDTPPLSAHPLPEELPESEPPPVQKPALAEADT